MSLFDLRPELHSESAHPLLREMQAQYEGAEDFGNSVAMFAAAYPTEYDELETEADGDPEHLEELVENHHLNDDARHDYLDSLVLEFSHTCMHSLYLCTSGPHVEIEWPHGEPQLAYLIGYWGTNTVKTPIPSSSTGIRALLEHYEENFDPLAVEW